MKDFYEIQVVRDIFFWVGESHYYHISEIRSTSEEGSVFVTRIETDPVRPQDITPGGQRYLGRTLREAKLVIINRLRGEALLPAATKSKVARMYKELIDEED